MWKKKVGKVFAGVLAFTMLLTSVPNMAYATEEIANTETAEQVEETVSGGDAVVVEENTVFEEKTISESSVSISGKMPTNATLVINEVVDKTSIENKVVETAGGGIVAKVYSAYDISIMDNDVKYQPSSNGESVEVTISNITLDVADGENLVLFHINDEGGLEQVAAAFGENSVTFTASNFSVYSVVGISYPTVTASEIGTYTFDNGVLTITSVEQAVYPDTYAWEGLSGQITKVVFADSVTSIPSNLFYDSLDNSKYDSITEVDLGNVSEIGSWAFYDCNGITKVYGGAENITVPTNGGNYPFTVLSTSSAIYYENQVLKDAEAAGGNRTQLFKVSFDSQGGSNVESQLVAIATDILKPTSTREGYKFKCWSYEGTTYDAFDGTITLANSDITLYAQWEELVKVTFNTGNYASTIDPVYVERNTTVERPDVTPTKPGYLFKDWYKVDESVSSLSSYLFDFSLPITNETTVYAHWNRAYTVTFSSAYGTPVASQIVADGGYVEEPTEISYGQEVDGHKFVGWYADSTYTTQWVFGSFGTKITGDTVIYAKWEDTTSGYTVTFDSLGGTAVESQTVSAYSLINEPTAPTKEGYRFLGWKTDRFGTSYWEFDWMTVENDITLYADWEQATTYTVSFNSKGGSNVDSQIVVEGDKAVAPTAPTKEGYTFKGWFTDEECTTEFDFNTGILNDTTLYAKWEEIKKYTVTFYHYGVLDTDLLDNPSINNGHVITLDGQTTAYCSVQVNEGEYIQPLDEVPELGKDLSNPMNVVKSDTTVNENDLNIYTFTGYYDGNEYDSNSFDFTKPITEDTDVYLKYTIEPVNAAVFLVLDEEASTITPIYNVHDVQILKDGETVKEPTAPVKEGYTLKYWLLNDNTLYDFSNPVYVQAYSGNLFRDESTILYFYANYEKEVVTYHKVTFYDAYGYVLETKSVLPGSTVTPTTKNINDWNNRVHLGWAEVENIQYNEYGEILEATYKEIFDFNTPITSDIELHPYMGFTVNFYGNGGTTPESQVIGYGNKVIKPVDPTREGYKLKGWYSDIECLTEYDFDTPVTKNMTLYAGWERDGNKYTITFDSNGGTPVESQIVLEGNPVIKPANPTKENCTFEYWYYLNGAYKVEYDFFFSAVHENLTLYAMWKENVVEPNKYTVEFNSNGGTAVESQTIVEGSKVVKPADPTKENYIFRGWYTDAELTSEYDFNTSISGNFTLYAKWEGKLNYQKDLEQETPLQFVWNDNLDEVKDAIKEDSDNQYDPTNNYWTAKMKVVSANVEDLEQNYSELQAANEKYEHSIAFDITIQKYISSDSDVTDIIDTSNVTEPKSELSISFSAPVLENNKVITEYSFYRVHNGVLDELPITYNQEANEFTFMSDKFSEYILYYEIKEVYEVTFNSNGGTAVASQKVIDGNKAVEPTAPIKSGYTFKGWYSDEELNVKYDFNNEITSDMSLYAKWEEIVNKPEPTPTPDPEPEEPDPTPEPEPEEPDPTPEPEPEEPDPTPEPEPEEPDPTPEPEPEEPDPTPEPEPEEPDPTPEPTPEPVEPTPTPEPTPEPEPEPTYQPEETPEPTEDVIIEYKAPEIERTSALETFKEVIKIAMIALSIGLGVLLGIVGLLLLLMYLQRKVKVYNNHKEDDYYDEDKFVLVEKTKITNEDNSLFKSLTNELFKKNEDNVWKVVVSEKVIDDEVTDEYELVINKSFAKRHNGETLVIFIEGRELEIPVIIFSEDNVYKFNSK